MVGRAWTEKEREYLRKYYPKADAVQDVAKHLNRTKYAILNQAEKMTLQRNPVEVSLNPLFRDIREQAVWLAAMFDGEGSPTYSQGNSDVPRVYGRISISNTNKALPKFLSTIMDFVIVSKENPSGTTSWLCNLNKKEAVREFIDMILPFTILKRPQLKLLRRLTKIKSDSEEAFDIAEELSELNRIRKHPTPGKRLRWVKI